MFNKGKHIYVCMYRLREYVQDGVMELFHVSTSEQVADMFTKALPSEMLKKHHLVFAGADDITVKKARAGWISMFGTKPDGPHKQNCGRGWSRVELPTTTWSITPTRTPGLRTRSLSWCDSRMRVLGQ
eukprot:1436126-Rhodomonas_salina.1